MRQAHEPLHDTLRIRRQCEHVEIADRIALAAEAAGDLDVAGRAGLTQMRQYLLPDARGLRVRKAFRALLLLARERFEDLGLKLFAKAAHRHQCAGLRGALQVRDVADIEPIGQQPHPLRAERRNPQQLHKAGRDLGLQIAMERQIAGLQQRSDLLGEIGADSGYFAERLGVHIRKRPGIVANRTSRVAIGSNPEEVGVLADFEHVRDLVKDPGDFLVLHPTRAPHYT